MRLSRRIAVVTARELKRFVAHAAARASREPESIRAAPSFRPLSAAEAEALLGGEFLAALSGARGLFGEAARKKTWCKNGRPRTSSYAVCGAVRSRTFRNASIVGWAATP